MKKKQLGRWGTRIGALLLSVCVFAVSEPVNVYATSLEAEVVEVEAGEIDTAKVDTMEEVVIEIGEEKEPESVASVKPSVEEKKREAEAGMIESEEEIPVLKGDYKSHKPYADATYELKYVDNGDGVEITGIDGTASGKLVLPEMIEGKVVNSIGQSAFSGCGGFVGELIIPKSVTKINKSAFSNCSGFTGDLIIPEGVTQIADSAFHSCSGFTGSLLIPKSVESIGNHAFYSCTGFKGDLEIHGGIIGEYAFAWSDGFKTLKIYEGVRQIGKGAFLFCDGFTGDLIIPKGVTSIEYEAFYECKGFDGDLVIEEGVISIGPGAFLYCGFKGTLTLPDSLTTVGMSAFENLLFTGDLIIPEGVISIGSYAFEEWKNATGTLRIPKGIEELGTAPFEVGGFSNVIIDEGVTNIPDYAFYYFKNLENVLIPDSVTSIGKNAFNECDSLVKIDIPEGVIAIGDNAFGWCDKLKSINIPQGITEIGNGWFCGCSSLTEVTYSDKITRIGEFAFKWCTSLTDIKIPDSVTEIGNSAFAESGLSGKVIIPEGVTNLSGCTFDKCTGVTQVVISDGVRSIGNSEFSGCSGLTEIEIPNSVTSIGSYAFRSCTGLSGELEIPQGITSIGDSAFYGCSGLNGKIRIPAGVIRIGKDVFKLTEKEEDSPTIIIYGKEGSYAETYAEEQGYGFVVDEGGDIGKYPLPDDFKVESVVSLGEYQVMILDNHGELVTDAQITVEYLNTGILIDHVYEGGIVKIPIDETSQKKGIAVYAKKTGMLDASAGYAVNKGGSGYLTMRKKTIDPYVDGVMIEGIQNMYADVTRHNYVVYKSDADKGMTVTLRIMTSGDTPGRYELVQGDRVIVSSTSNLITVNLAKELELGGQTPVIVLYDRGNRRISEKKVRFTAVEKDEKLAELTAPKVSYGQKLSFGLEDVDMPLLNNSTLTLDTKIELPLKVEHDGNKIRVEIGDENILKQAGNPTENFKKMIEKYNKEKINSAISNHFRKGSLAGFDLKIAVFGYGEGEMDPKTGNANVEVGMYAKITAKQGITWYVFLGPVPFYGKVTGELKNQTEGKVVLHVADGRIQNPTLDFDNELSLTLGAGGGVGFNDAACIDLTGNGKVTWKHLIKEKDTLSVQAYAKARVVLLFLSWEKTWPSKTLQLLPEIKVLGANSSFMDMDFLNTTDYQLLTRDYLLDDVSIPVLKSNGDDTQVIINGLYPDAKPKLVSYKGTDYLFYLDDQKERGAEDRTALVYRKEVNGAFSDPVLVEDDKTGDFDYDVKTCEDGIYVLWQDGKKSLAGITTLQEAAEALTLSAAKVTDAGVTLLESPAVSEGLAPISPVLVDTGKEIMACWYENSSNDLLQSGQGTSRFYGQALGTNAEKQKIGETVRTITTTDFGMFENALSVAYTVDEDNDISTVEDREIYVASEGETRRLTDNEVADSNALFGEVSGKQVLVYYSDKNLACTDGTTTELLLDAEDPTVTNGLVSDDFQFVSESANPAIVWKDAYWMGEEAGQGMTMIRFKDGSWGKPVRVAGTTDSLVAFSVLEKNADVLRVVYTGKGEEAGKEITRLYETEGRERASISLVRIAYEQEDYVPGENLPFSVTLQNTGALKAEDYEIIILNEAGETIHTQKGSEAIAVGEEKIITLDNFSPADTGDLQTLRIQINGDGRKQDAMDFTLGGADLSLRTDISYEEDDQILNLQMINGSNLTENMKLTITGSEEEVLYEKEYQSVPGKSSVNYLCKLDKFFDMTEADSIKLSLESMGRTETYLFDNEATLYRPGSVTKITEVTLEQKELELTSGETTQLQVTTDGEGTVLYESNNPDSVSVSESGVVTAKTPGSATVTAYTEDGGSAICVITVKEAAPSKPKIALGDVKESQWAYNYVMYVCENAYMKGKDTDEAGRILFDPEGTLTRAEFVQVLYNAEGKPQVTYKDRFSDVPENQWYTNAIIWGTEKGIVSGYGNGKYGVSDPITREQLATMLNKYAQYKGYKVDATTELDAYTDTSQISDWAVNYMKWIVGSSIMSGKGDRLDPQGNATRAECATLVNKFHISYGE